MHKIVFFAAVLSLAAVNVGQLHTIFNISSVYLSDLLL